MSEELVRVVARSLDRRTFLRRGAATVASVVLGLFGLSQPAFAFYSWHCCQLCYAPTSNCRGNCGPSNIWCWYCSVGTTEYACCEKFSNFTDCSNQNWCSPVLYSCGTRLGVSPAG
jgi:hypothetical protein